ncbi:hypothetical protein N9766_02780 [Flavobacteriaceae bacterium]|uniref:hypothetical protein n=1 Tax=Maribacter sp. MAR_2009_72 TaxID=1250050 RepID=UPI0011A0C778|nr:hypothetical protein [Maribacter sp. MAR_2009_72]MDB4175267.1 hypothetical protein [Flavobacteriaceae bacterium]
MKSKIKIIFLTLTIGLIFIVGFLGYGMYLMEIEDQYGDFQNIHFESKTGDLIINKSTSEFGIIEKTWKRTNIRTKEKDSTDLYFWIYKNGVETKSEVYRPKSETELVGIKYSELLKKIEKSELKFITRN